jgi:hypothetical protein
LPSYRIYRVGHGGRLLLGEAFHAESDTLAIETARVLQDAERPMELWEGGRLVGRFSSLGLFTAGGSG